MNPVLFGEWTVHAVPGYPRMFRLHNPVGPDLWGADLDPGGNFGIPHKVVPCDDFVHDLSSSPWFLWLIYPPTAGKLAATIHDWGYRAHKLSVDELLVELSAWFDSMGWDYVVRVRYIDWLRAVTREQWDYVYYVLSAYDVEGPKRRWMAWKTLRAVGGISWRLPSKSWTKVYREAKNG